MGRPNRSVTNVQSRCRAWKTSGQDSIGKYTCVWLINAFAFRSSKYCLMRHRKQSLEVFIMLLYCLLVLTMSDAWRRPHDPLRPHHHHHHHLLHHHFYLLNHSNPQTHNSIQRWELWKMCQLVAVVSSWVNTWRGQSTEYWVHVSISDKIHLKIHCWQVSLLVFGNQWDYQSFVCGEVMC